MIFFKILYLVFNTILNFISSFITNEYISNDSVSSGKKKKKSLISENKCSMLC